MKQYNPKKFIDITVTIKTGMFHWPGDPPIKIKSFKSMELGDRSNVSHMDLGTHTGTHMDAPFHSIKNGKSLDQMPLAATIGQARVIAIKDKESIKVDELKNHKIRKGERILFKTANSMRCWKTDSFTKDFVYMSEEASAYLALRGICSVGIDYLSIGGFYSDRVKIHQNILKAGIWIIEGLNLSKVKPGRYHLICLPLKILNSDGAPARAVLYPFPS